MKFTVQSIHFDYNLSKQILKRPNSAYPQVKMVAVATHAHKRQTANNMKGLLVRIE